MTAPAQVRQLEARGCGPACLAMITGRSYDEAKAMLGRGEFRSRGTSRKALDEALAREGFAVRRFFTPVGLFADVHLVELRNHDPRGWHFVVVLRDGTVLDPDRPADAPPVFYRECMHAVRCIAGVYRVEER